MKIKTIAILVELENGNAHQVLASKEMKDLVVNLLATDKGIIQLSEQIEPITFETKRHESKP